jgi:hypothetical protein
VLAGLGHWAASGHISSSQKMNSHFITTPGEYYSKYGTK